MTDLIPGGLLSDSERERLGALEDTIRRGLQSFMEAGQALTEVRDSRLYRDGYATFEDYCRDRWSISRPRAYELIAGAEAVSGIPDTMPKPINAGQAVELARVPMEHRVEVWGKAVEQTDGKPTAAAVRDARDRIAPRPAAPAPPQPPAPRPGSASNRPLAEPSQPATAPSAPEYSEPSLFPTDEDVADVETAGPDAPAPWIENAAREAAEQLAEVKATFNEAAHREAELSAMPGMETLNQRIRREQPYANAAINIRQAIEEIPFHLDPADLASRIPDYSEHNVDRLPEALAWLMTFSNAYQARRAAVA